jgi:ACS family tartrate transporter-like MFS transporter
LSSTQCDSFWEWRRLVFFPGVIYYLSLWFPATYRARAISGIIIGIPLSQVLGAPLGGALLGLTGVGHLSGWQWLFLVEGLPPAVLGFAALAYLTDRPEDARWLPKAQRDWVSSRIELERQQTVSAHVSPFRALGHPVLWILILPYFALCAIAYGATFWTPLLVRDALGTSNSATSLIVGGIYLLAALLYPLAGMLSDRRDDRCGMAALGLAFYCVGGVGVALLPHSLLRVAALVVLRCRQSDIHDLVLVRADEVSERVLRRLPGLRWSARLAQVAAFLDPRIIGFLKQATGSDSGAFLGLAGLALLGALVCIGLRQAAAFSPSPESSRVWLATSQSV